MEAILRNLKDCKTLLEQALAEVTIGFDDSKHVIETAMLFAALGAVSSCLGSVGGAIAAIELGKAIQNAKRGE